MYTGMKQFVIIFSHNDQMYDATVKDLSYPAGKYFMVEYACGRETGAIPRLQCIDPVKLKWDSAGCADKDLCQTIGHAIAMQYKKEYLAQQQLK